jgi:hypothetical protein
MVKNTVVGNLAPKKVSKRGVITVDGRRRMVALKDGLLTVYETEAAEGGGDPFVVEIKFCKVSQSSWAPSSTSGMPPTVFVLDVDPQMVNREFNHLSSSTMGGGGMMIAGGGMLHGGRAETHTAHAGQEVQKGSLMFDCETKERVLHQ